MSNTATRAEIQVLTLTAADSGWRGETLRGVPEVLGRAHSAKVKVDELARHVRQFTQQMETILAETPTQLGEFEFAEFEVSAAINAKGELSICGLAGAEAGIEGGLKFVFRKSART